MTLQVGQLRSKEREEIMCLDYNDRGHRSWLIMVQCTLIRLIILTTSSFTTLEFELG